MHYIVFDLEWNQAFPHEASPAGNSLPCEIIQIGAVRLNEQKEIVDKFDMDVRPVQHPQLHPRVQQLTHLRTGDVAGAPTFDIVYRQFRRWCGSSFLFFTWGPDDMPVLHRNLRFYHFPEDWLPDCYNLQLFFNRQTDQPPGQRSLLFAMEYFKLKTDGQMHNAFTDALCTARVFQRLDIRAGMAYCSQRARVGSPLCTTCDDSILERMVSEYANKHLALQSPVMGKLRCPHCHKLLSAKAAWKPVSTQCYGVLARCAKHGTYLFRLRLTRHEDGWRASRLTRLADAQMQQDFITRIGHNKSQRRNREARRREKRK